MVAATLEVMQSAVPAPATSEVRLRTHPLPEDAVSLVLASYARLEDRLRAGAIAFYEYVFDAAPALRSRFPRDDADQRQIALSFVGFVMANLCSPQHLFPLLEHMAQRGFARGTSAESFDAIGRALLAALRELEGPNWTVDTAHGWAVTYVWVTTAIRQGLEDAAEAHVA